MMGWGCGEVGLWWGGAMMGWGCDGAVMGL